VGRGGGGRATLISWMRTEQAAVCDANVLCLHACTHTHTHTHAHTHTHTHTQHTQGFADIAAPFLAVFDEDYQVRLDASK